MYGQPSHTFELVEGSMKKLVTFRFDADLLEKARKSAQAENRSLTNYIETIVKRSTDRAQDTVTSRADTVSPPPDL
jgi:hypothetical protein